MVGESPEGAGAAAADGVSGDAVTGLIASAVRVRCARTADVGRAESGLPDWATFEPPRAADRDAVVPVRSCASAERLVLACPDEEPDAGLSAQATAAPLEIAAPTPSAIAKPPTRPTYFDAFMLLPNMALITIDPAEE
ncbi:MAG: hypothetical protein U0R81_03095 [Mycobacterium sp.]